MKIVEEMMDFGFDIPSATLKDYFRDYEYNTGALELVRVTKMRPCMKHINVVYHHFRDYIRRGLILVVVFYATN